MMCSMERGESLPLGLRSEPTDADPLTAAGMAWGGCAQITCLSASVATNVCGNTPETQMVDMWIWVSFEGACFMR